MLSLELRERFCEALEREGGNVSVASRVVGVNARTAQDWDRGLRSIGRTRIYPDGRKVDYRTGVTTIVTIVPMVTAATT